MKRRDEFIEFVAFEVFLRQEGSNEFIALNANVFHSSLHKRNLVRKTQSEKNIEEKKMKNQQEEEKEGLSFRRKLIMAGKQKLVPEEEGQSGDFLMIAFNILSEGCISTILSFTSPRDVIRLSLVSTTFKSASESDIVWEKLLPSIYPEIISRSSFSLLPSSSTATTTSRLGGFSSKKKLCCSLFDNPIIIDGGSKSFGLEKESGKICFMLGARALSIVWGSDPAYWRWRPSSSSESRFPEVAELLNVCWMEITGKVETRMLSPKTMYGAYFVIKTAEKNYGLDKFPGQFSIRFVRGGGECSEAREMFFKRGEREQQPEFPLSRGDGWMEIEMGEFYNDGEKNEEVEMHVLETNSQWKCGLIVQGIELRPKYR